MEAVFPLINFVDPTPEDGTAQAETNVKINVSITEANLKEVILQLEWN